DPSKTGVYACRIQNPCGATATLPAAVEVDDVAGAVGNTLKLVRGTGGDLRLGWADVAPARDYGVYRDTAPGGGFTTLAGSASGGAGGVALAPGGEPLVLFRVAARTACGAGTK